MDSDDAQKEIHHKRNSALLYIAIPTALLIIALIVFFLYGKYISKNTPAPEVSPQEHSTYLPSQDFDEPIDSCVGSIKLWQNGVVFGSSDDNLRGSIEFFERVVLTRDYLDPAYFSQRTPGGIDIIDMNKKTIQSLDYTGAPIYIPTIESFIIYNSNRLEFKLYDPNTEKFYDLLTLSKVSEDKNSPSRLNIQSFTISPSGKYLGVMILKPAEYRSNGTLIRNPLQYLTLVNLTNRTSHVVVVKEMEVTDTTTKWYLSQWFTDNDFTLGYTSSKNNGFHGNHYEDLYQFENIPGIPETYSASIPRQFKHMYTYFDQYSPYAMSPDKRHKAVTHDLPNENIDPRFTTPIAPDSLGIYNTESEEYTIIAPFPESELSNPVWLNNDSVRVDFSGPWSSGTSSPKYIVYALNSGRTQPIWDNDYYNSFLKENYPHQTHTYGTITETVYLHDPGKTTVQFITNTINDRQFEESLITTGDMDTAYSVQNQYDPEYSQIPFTNEALHTFPFIDQHSLKECYDDDETCIETLSEPKLIHILNCISDN